jgi:hypothetical protein
MTNSKGRGQGRRGDATAGLRAVRAGAGGGHEAGSEDAVMAGWLLCPSASLRLVGSRYRAVHFFAAGYLFG